MWYPRYTGAHMHCLVYSTTGIYFILFQVEQLITSPIALILMRAVTKTFLKYFGKRETIFYF